MTAAATAEGVTKLTRHLVQVAAALGGEPAADVDPFIPARRVATLLGISDAQVYTLVHEGQLEAIRLGNRIQIPASAVAALIDRSRIQPRTTAAAG